MKISKPGIAAMHEYLLYYGEEWVMKQFKMTGDQIDDLLYGGKLPTEVQQGKKKRLAAKEDSEAKAYMLRNFKEDHFIWDKPWKKHIKCQNVEEDSLPEWTEDFLEDWSSEYNKFVSMDMRRHGVSHGDFEYAVPPRVINKTNSKTQDDIVQDMFLRQLILGKIFSSDRNDFVKKRDFSKGISGHKNNDENFLENISSLDIDSVCSENKQVKHINDTKDNY